MSKVFIYSLILFFLCNVKVFSCDDHNAPGALPPSPHGGQLGEAEPSGGHASEKEGDLEMFVEVKTSGQNLLIYPMVLEEKQTKVFKPLSPSAALVLKEIKIEYPRSKKIETVDHKANSDHWEVKLSQSKDRRFFVHLTVIDDKETKLAKVQIEK